LRTRKIIYMESILVSNEEIMICAKEERERVCVRRKERTQIEGKKKKKGNILCGGDGKHSVKRQYMQEKKREKSSLFYAKY
jgi:hypothetical protein